MTEDDYINKVLTGRHALWNSTHRPDRLARAPPRTSRVRARVQARPAPKPRRATPRRPPSSTTAGRLIQNSEGLRDLVGQRGGGEHARDQELRAARPRSTRACSTRSSSIPGPSTTPSSAWRRGASGGRRGRISSSAGATSQAPSPSRPFPQATSPTRRCRACSEAAVTAGSLHRPPTRTASMRSTFRRQ